MSFLCRFAVYRDPVSYTCICHCSQTLLKAARNGKLRECQLALENKADVNYQDCVSTVLHTFAKKVCQKTTLCILLHTMLIKHKDEAGLSTKYVVQFRIGF